MTLDQMTSRHQPVPQKKNLHALAGVLMLAGALALGGCSMVPFDDRGTSPAPASTTAASDPVPTPAEPETPATPAQEFSTKVTDSLSSLAATTKSPNRDQIRAAMVEAGANSETLEVSVDITPTGLAVDAIEAADVIDGECVVGQIREGQVAVTLLPPLATGRCFVGDIH